MTVVFREREREGLLFAGLHAANGVFEFGEHAALTENEGVVFGSAAFKGDAFLHALEVERDAVFVLSGTAFFNVEGDALLAHHFDRLFDGGFVNLAAVALEAERREVDLLDFGHDFELGLEGHEFLVFGRNGIDRGSADDLLLGFAGGFNPSAADEFIDGFIEGFGAVHHANSVHRNVAATEAGHTGVLGVALEVLFGKLFHVGSSHLEFERVLERVDGGVRFDDGRGRFGLRLFNSLFLGLFDLFFGHFEFFAKKSSLFGISRQLTRLKPKACSIAVETCFPCEAPESERLPIRDRAARLKICPFSSLCPRSAKRSECQSRIRSFAL